MLRKMPGVLALVALVLSLDIVASPASGAAEATPPPTGGYWLVAADGGVFTFGNARFFGSTGGMRLNQPIVGMAPTSDGGGYWLVAADGGIFTFGNARFFGSTGGMRLNQPIVGMAPTSDGGGYDLLGADGGVFTFGDAVFHGSAAGRLRSPATAMAVRTWQGATIPDTSWEAPSGDGYRILSADGIVTPFDVPDLGSSSVAPGDAAIALAPTSNGGYWIAGRAGSVGTSGDVGRTTYGPQVDYYGELAGPHAPVVAMAGTADDKGYYLFARDGGVFTFGDAVFYGSASPLHLRAPIAGGAAAPALTR